MHSNLRSYLEVLHREGELVRVDAAVDPRLELAEIHRRVIAAGGPALLFANPVGSPYPVVTNLFGTRRRVELAFGRRPQQLIAEAARAPEELMPPSPGRLWAKRGLLGRLLRVGLKPARRAPVTAHAMAGGDLSHLPALTTWSQDGGPFLTLPLVYTEHPLTGQHNLGMYRMQIYDAAEAGMHFQIGKGGGFHLSAAEQAGLESIPANVFLGGPPALILSAITPLPENVPELIFGSLMLGKRLPMHRSPLSALPMPAEAEFVLSGSVPCGVRRPEGPFGDHYGYYSLLHDYPVFRLRTLFHRKNPIFPATVVGKPRQEDFFIGDFLQELLSPLFPLTMPGVRDLWSYGETGYHSLAAAVVAERYKREAMVSAFRILGEGQLSLTKFLLLTDRAVDLRDFRATLQHILERSDLRTDLFVFPNLSMDSLDYTGAVVNQGSKGVWLGLGDPIRSLPSEFSGSLPQGISKAVVYCPGCLVIEGGTAEAAPDLAQRAADHDAWREWPLVVLTDDADRAVRSDMNFLWTTFTRFDPASDIYTRATAVVNNQRIFEPPIVLDARLRPGFPDELFCDEKTSALVTHRWREYFPRGQAMGDSERGHLD